MLSHMVKDLLRFAFLYLEFYLPFGKKIVTFYTVTGISLVFEDSFNYVMISMYDLLQKQ